MHSLHLVALGFDALYTWCVYMNTYSVLLPLPVVLRVLMYSTPVVAAAAVRHRVPDG